MNNKQSAIVIRDLAFSYSPHNEAILNIAKWSVNRGDKIFLRGPSGSGKSTLLNLLAGILTPTQGCIKILDKPLDTMKSQHRDRFRAQHIGLVFQQFNLIPYLSVRDNILLAAGFSQRFTPTSQKKAAKNLQQQILELCQAVNIHPDLLQQKTAQLSIGQQQRVAIIRALINSPEILMVDEPTSALDADNRERFLQLLMKLVNQHQITLIFVSHDTTLASHFDQQIELSQLNQTEHAGVIH